MNRLENAADMEAYIQRSNLTNHAKQQYAITAYELCILNDLYKKDPFKALSLTFDLGRAKGYRAAKYGK